MKMKIFTTRRIVLGLVFLLFILASLTSSSLAFADSVDEQDGFCGANEMTGDAQLDAVTYTVSFNTGTNGSEVASQTIEAGYLVMKPNDPTKKGYDFAGWYTDNNYTTEYNFELPVNTDMTLYAKWSSKASDLTDSEGNAYVIDPTSDKCTRVNVCDLDLKDISGCTVTVNLTGAFTVDLTEAALSDVETKGVIVCLSEYISEGAQVWIQGKSVTVNKADGSVLGTQTTDAMGNTRFEFKVDTTRVRMYRLYNKWTGEHFYTADASEQIDLVRLGWTDEGTGWYAPKVTTIPVYRLYNRYVDGGDHHYTTSSDEKDACVEAGWSYEGIAWYSPDGYFSGQKPLYRQYNPNAKSGAHNYTLSEDETKKVLAAGWKDEGIAWYGFESE